MVKKGYYGNEGLSFSNLALFEHFYTISNTFVPFPYTLIQSWTLLYDPKINKNFIPVIPFFNHLFSVIKGYYGNECFGLSSLLCFYSISNTLIQSWILLYDDLKRSQAKHLQQFYHLIGLFWSVLNLKPRNFLHINVSINVITSIKTCFIEFFECYWKMNKKMMLNAALLNTVEILLI